MHKEKIVTKSKKETFELGEKMAWKMKRPLVLGLTGELGAGKTQFIKGLAMGFGINKTITSPTFVILKKYAIGNKEGGFIHIDCYRLSYPEELLDLGLGEYIEEGKNVIAIEWADKIKDILPKDTVWINFINGGENSRTIRI